MTEKTKEQRVEELEKFMTTNHYKKCKFCKYKIPFVAKELREEIKKGCGKLFHDVFPNPRWNRNNPKVDCGILITKECGVDFTNCKNCQNLINRLNKIIGDEE